jgi:hypothetical protein
MSALKEPHYFADFEMAPEFDNFLPVIRDRHDYHKLFTGSEPFVAVGDASPSYLCDPECADRIKSAIPKAKIIISLRNPVERAYSHYLMECRRGREVMDFEQALQFDLARAERGWGKSAQYIELGLYADQVKSFLTAFGRDRVLVVLFEELVRDTRRTMEQVADYLGIDPGAFPESVFMQAHNSFEVSRGPLARKVLRMQPLRVWAKKWVPRGARQFVRNRFLFAARPKPELLPSIQRRLASGFEEDLQALEELLGRDLTALRRPG